MTSYTTSAATTGADVSVLHAAITTLTNNEFAIASRDERSATLTGPGLNSTRQNPLLGASRIRLSLSDYELRLDAELGGVDSMRRFLMRFPFLLGLGLGLFFGLGGLIMGPPFGVRFGVPWVQGWAWLLVAIGAAMLPVTPWLILSPMIANMVRNRTQNALATLVKNAVLNAKPD